MPMHTRAAITFMLLAGTSGAPSFAAQHDLEFRLVVTPVEVKNLEAPNIEGQAIFARYRQ